MDALDRADEALARAQARGRDVVTPASATSPMDCETTLRLPRIPARDPDDLDPDATIVIADGPLRD